MKRHTQKRFGVPALAGITAALLLACAGRANAQAPTGTPSGGGAAGASRGGGGSTGGSFSFGGGSGGSLTSGFGSSGGSFSGGGSSMTGGFSGGTSTGFTGGTSMTGGTTGGAGFRGATGGAGGVSGYTSPGGAGSGNPFGTYYSNPMAMGLPGNTRTQPTGIGQPLYNATSSTTTGSITGGLSMTGTGRGGMQGMSGSGVGLLNQMGGGYGSGSSMRRVPAYVIRWSESSQLPPPRPPGSLRSDLQQVLTRSSVFNGNKDIQVAAEGSVIVLQGTVSSERERRLAENMLRLSPGVRQVRNELQVREVAPPPRKTQ